MNLSHIAEEAQADSLVEMHSCLAEKSVMNISHGKTFQAERIGYFCVDTDSSSEEVSLCCIERVN